MLIKMEIIILAISSSHGCLASPFPSSAMVAIPTILTLLGLATTVYSTALTTLLTPNERLCFYADVDKAGEKIGVRTLYYLATIFIHL